MPRAPQLDQQVANAPLPGVRIGGAPSPESYGAGVGALTSRVGMALYEQEALNADRTSVFEADRQAAELQTSLEQKLRGLKGKNVLGADEILRKEWDDGITKIESGLSTERQRAGFARTKALRGDQLNRLTQAHVATEFEHFQDQETDAGIKSALDRVRANPGEPAILQGEFRRIGSITGAYAVRKGWAGETTAAQLKDPAFYEYYASRGLEPPLEGQRYMSAAATEFRDKAMSAAHREVIIGQTVQGQDLTAAEYFKKHKDALIAGDRDAVERVIEEGSTRGEAQRLVRGLLREGKSEAEILQHIDEKVENPKIVDLAHQLAGRHFREQAAIKREASDQGYLQAVNAVDAFHQENPTVPIEARSLVAPDQWAAMTLPERHALEERAKSLTRYEKPDRPNDDPLWLDFLALPPEKVAQLSRREFDERYWSKFDNHTRQRAETQWNTYRDALSRKEDKQVDPKVTASLTFKDQVNNAWALSGLIDPSKERSRWSKEETQQFVRFEDQAAQALQHYELTKLEGKRHATPDEVREVIKKVRDQAVQKVFTPGWFGAKERPAISLEEDERKQAIVPVDKIPADSLGDLRNYIRSKGKQITEDKLRRAYAQYVLGNRQAFDAIIDEP